MRAVLLITFIVCLYFHFQKKNVDMIRSDSLSTKRSSIKKIVPAKSQLPVLADSFLNESTSMAIVSDENDELVAEAEEAQEFDEDDLSQLPWDDIEEGWKTNLKEFLVSVDPEKADEMFSAYMEEKKKYVERVDFSDRENGASEQQTPSSDDPLAETDSKEGDLERSHNDNLKEIFGNHYSQIESLHKEYVDSVQYLNRSPVKFSISL